MPYDKSKNQNDEPETHSKVDNSEYEPDSDSESTLHDAQISQLRAIFRDQLVACLEESSRGRRGLFSNIESLTDGVIQNSWPEAARLRELAFALQSILAQSEENDTLCDQFLDLCSIHGVADPGEPRVARAFLAAIAGE